MRRLCGSTFLAVMLVACAETSDTPGTPACADPASGPSELPPCVSVPYTVTDHMGIGSDDGFLTLLSGKVAIERLSLFEGTREVVWLENQVLDIGASSGELLAAAPIPPGTYDRIEMVFAPLSSTRPTVEAEIDGDAFPTIDVWYEERVVGERPLDPELVVSADDGDQVELPISLFTLFFYTWPYTASVDGIYSPTGSGGSPATLGSHLLNLGVPRVIP